MRADTTNSYQSSATSGPVGAVIVTYQTPRHRLEQCLDSLRTNDIHDVSVVNNDLDNIGFASAANQGASKLTNELVLFINPDARLLPRTINQAVQQFHSDERVGLVGLMLCDDARQPEKTCFGPPVNMLSIFTRHIQRNPIPTHPLSVGWVSGGAMLIRKKVFNQLSGFDPQFFLYWEDVDLCHRARQAGWKIYLLPTVLVAHQRGASLPDLTQKTRYYDQSADKYFHKHYSKPIWLLQRYCRLIYRLLSPLVD